MFKQIILIVSLTALSVAAYVGPRIIELDRSRPQTIASFRDYTPDKIGLCDGYMEMNNVESTTETNATPVVAAQVDFQPDHQGLCDGLPTPGELAEEYPVDDIEVSYRVDLSSPPYGGDPLAA